MAELSIQWESVERVSKEERGVVTGDSAEDAEAAEASPLRWSDKPIVVYVCDEAACDGFDKLEEVVLKDEKIGLGMKAFRRVKMHPDDVENDELLAGKGKEVPRMLIIEPVKLKISVLEKGKLKTSKLYKSMQKASDKFYKQKLDKIVKAHLKLLTEQDQLANAEKTLQQKLGRLAGEDGKKAKKDLEKAKAEMEKVREELAGIKSKAKELWTLTPKASKA